MFELKNNGNKYNKQIKKLERRYRNDKLRKI